MDQQERTIMDQETRESRYLDDFICIYREPPLTRRMMYIMDRLSTPFTFVFDDMSIIHKDEIKRAMSGGRFSHQVIAVILVGLALIFMPMTYTYQRAMWIKESIKLKKELNVLKQQIGREL